MERRWQEAEAEDSSKGVSDGVLHLSIWTVPQQPQMTSENRPGYEQGLVLLSREKQQHALELLTASFWHNAGILTAENSTCHGKIHQDKQPCIPSGHMVVFRPTVRCHCGWRADTSPSEPFLPPHP